MWLRLVRFCVGVSLLPFCVAATRVLYDLVGSIQPGTAAVPMAAWALIGGYLLWLVLYYTMSKPVRTYVLAHELTHALWGAAMGARVSRMRITKEGGSVNLSRTNFLITLAPYFFPFYTMLAIAAYGIASIFVDLTRYYPLWLGIIGFTWGFHFTFTIGTLFQRQSDIQQCGHVFSYALIYMLNVLGICLWVVAVTSAELEQFVGLLTSHTANSYLFGVDACAALIDRLREI